MKKILCIHSSSDLYGADRIFNIVVKSLSDDYKTEVILPSNGPLVSVLKESTAVTIDKSLPVIVRSKLGFLNLVFLIVSFICFSVKGVIRSLKYDAVYVNTLSSALALPVFYLTRKRVILHVHEMISEYGFFGRFLVNFSVFFSNNIICVSEAVKKDIALGLFSFYKHGVNKTTVIRNGIIDIDDFDGRKQKPSNEKFELLLLGRLMPEKGHWFLLEALSLLPTQITKNIMVNMVGSPPPNREHLHDELLNKIAEEKLDNMVRLYPFIDNPTSLINKCDVMVVPSKIKDSFPTTVLEGLRSGKPVIATSHGGASEVITDNYNGFLIEHTDVKYFSEVISKMYHIWCNGKDYELMAFNSRKSYMDNYTYDMFSKKIKDYFKSNVQSRREI